MPKSLSTSSLVTSTKDKKSGSRKCKKPCQSSSSSSCCTEQCIDCCSSQFQRLSRFAAYVTGQQLNNGWGNLDTNSNNQNPTTALKNRCGALIAPPNINPADSSPTLGFIGIAGAYANETGCSAANGSAGVAPVPTDLEVAGYEVAEAAYYFVNEFAYGTYEPGCHNDQLYGWFVNISSGELQLFTQTDGVPTNATRACLVVDCESTCSAQKRQLKVLNKLYKLSKSAIKEVNGIPSQEGNIVEVCDCKGERWLLYINTASEQNGSPLCECNYQFAVVATKLC